MRKEVEAPQPLDLGIVNLVFTWRPRMRKSRTTHEIDMDGHLVPLGIKIHLLHKQRTNKAQSLCKQFIDLVGRVVASAAFASRSPHRRGAWRAIAPTREPSQPRLWICGRRSSSENGEV
jgi:hypothetical protein